MPSTFSRRIAKSDTRRCRGSDNHDLVVGLQRDAGGAVVAAEVDDQPPVAVGRRRRREVVERRIERAVGVEANHREVVAGDRSRRRRSGRVAHDDQAPVRLPHHRRRAVDAAERHGLRPSLPKVGSRRPSMSNRAISEVSRTQVPATTVLPSGCTSTARPSALPNREVGLLATVGVERHIDGRIGPDARDREVGRDPRRRRVARQHDRPVGLQGDAVGHVLAPEVHRHAGR